MIGSLIQPWNTGCLIHDPRGPGEAEPADGFQIEAIVKRLLARGHEGEREEDGGRDPVRPVLTPLDGPVHLPQLSDVIPAEDRRR